MNEALGTARERKVTKSGVRYRKKKDDKQLAMAHDPINDNVATKNIQKELIILDD